MQGQADPEDHCSLNVALYGAGGSRWAMTERGRRRVQRDRQQFQIGPSRLHWDGQALVVDIDEVTVPLPSRLRGRVRVIPQGLCTFNAALDEAGHHRWGPIAPCARIEVTFDKPGLSWKGHAYLDSNEGDEPIDVPFRDWDWSRATLADGSTAVIYDVRAKSGAERVIAQRFTPQGSASGFETPARQHLPRSLWRLPRSIRSEPEGPPARVSATLEDTPFYVRSTLEATILGERVTAIHESLDVPRVVSRSVRLMLPWRMPRRA